MTISHVPPDLARRILDAAGATAADLGLRMSFAIVDSAGYLTDFTRMPDADWVIVGLAQGKARAAVAFGQPTQALAERWAAAPYFVDALVTQNAGTLVPAAGGIPIEVDGHLIGAIGASGGTGQQDHTVVSTAVSEGR